MATVLNPTPIFNFGIKLGSNHTVIINVLSDAVTPANLSAFGGHVQFRDADNNVMLEMQTSDTTLTMDDSGNVTMFFGADTTAPITIPDASDAWTYDVKIWNGNTKYTIVQGTVTAFAQITV